MSTAPWASANHSHSLNRLVVVSKCLVSFFSRSLPFAFVSNLFSPILPLRSFPILPSPLHPFTSSYAVDTDGAR